MSEEKPESKLTPEEVIEHLEAENKQLRDENHMLGLKLESKYEDCTANTLDHIWQTADYDEYCKAHELLVKFRVSRDKFQKKDKGC
jgi:hypothetical protein